MSEFAEGMVETNGVTLHYYRSTPAGGNGASRPTILMLHGVTDSGLCWARVARALQAEYDLVMPDARGHGLSEATEMGYGVEDRAADAAGLIQALALDRPVIAGHSMGAETSIALAALYPGLVRAVVLEDPPWPGRYYGSTTEERLERVEQMRHEILARKKKTVDELVAEARREHPAWHEEELHPWAESKLQVSPQIANRILSPRRRWSDYVRQAQCPVLLLTGDVDRGSIVSAETAREAALYWKNGRTVHIPGAGHSIHRDQFQPYMQALQNFLAQVTQ